MSRILPQSKMKQEENVPCSVKGIWKEAVYKPGMIKSYIPGQKMARSNFHVARKHVERVLERCHMIRQPGGEYWVLPEVSGGGAIGLWTKRALNLQLALSPECLINWMGDSSLESIRSSRVSSWVQISFTGRLLEHRSSTEEGSRRLTL